MKRTLTLALSVVVTLFWVTSCKKKPTPTKYEEESLEESITKASEVFTSDERRLGKPKELQEIKEFLNEVATLVYDEGELDMDKIFSIEAMIQYLRDTGSLDEVNTPAKKRAFEKGFRQGAAKNLKLSLKQSVSKDFKIARVVDISESEKEVYIQFYFHDLGIILPYRWWIIKTADGWRIYDHEDLSTGLRAIKLMGLIIGSSSKSGALPEWVPNFQAVSNWVQTGQIHDPNTHDDILKIINSLLGENTPDDIKRFAYLMKTSIAQSSQQYEHALRIIGETEEKGLETPMTPFSKAANLIGVGNYDHAIENLSIYMDRFGRDSDALGLLSECHYHMGDLNAAKEACLEGLKDNPNSQSCVISLSMSLSVNKQEEEWLPHILKMRNPQQSMESTLNYLYSIELTDHYKEVYRLYAKQFPESENLDDYNLGE